MDFETIKIVKSAAKKMNKIKKRKFQAEVALQYFDGRSRLTETRLGWCRKSVKLGLDELRTGITCLFNYSKAGVKRKEIEYPNLEKDLEELLKDVIYADEKLGNTFKYLKISAREVVEKLVELKGYKKTAIAERTMSTILNRLGYNRKSIKKNKPLKKNPGGKSNIGKMRPEGSALGVFIKLIKSLMITQNL